MGRGSGSFLLSDGDVLTLSSEYTLVFRTHFGNGNGAGSGENCFDALQQVEMGVSMSRCDYCPFSFSSLQF